MTEKAVEVLYGGALRMSSHLPQPAKPTAHCALGGNGSGIPADPAQSLRFWITETRAELDL